MGYIDITQDQEQGNGKQTLHQQLEPGEGPGKDFDREQKCDQENVPATRFLEQYQRYKGDYYSKDQSAVGQHLAPGFHFARISPQEKSACIVQQG